MKKIIAIVLSCILTLALFAACNGEGTTPTGNNPTQTSANKGATAQDIYFAPSGVRIEMGAAPEAVLEALKGALGEPVETFETPSCALKAKDIRYTYAGFSLTATYPEQGEDYVTQIKLLDDTYTVPGGVTIGSTPEEIFTAYGTDYNETNAFYKYTQGLSIITFAVKDGKVAQIIYDFDFENA